MNFNIWWFYDLLVAYMPLANWWLAPFLGAFLILVCLSIIHQLIDFKRSY